MANLKTVQVPAEVKLQVTNQAQVMRNLYKDFQDIFASVDPGSVFGKSIAKAFSKVESKLNASEGLLGNEFFSEADLRKVASQLSSISELFGQINIQARGVSANALGLDTTEIENAEKHLKQLQERVRELKGAKVGTLLGADSKDLQEFAKLSKTTGFSGGKSYTENYKSMEAAVGRVTESYGQLTIKAQGAEEALRQANEEAARARVNLSMAEGQLANRKQANMDIASQIMGVKVSGKGATRDSITEQYLSMLDSQLDQGQWVAGGENFAHIIAGWLEVDEADLAGTATDIVNNLKNAIRTAMAGGPIASNKLRASAKSVLGGEEAALRKDAGYTELEQKVQTSTTYVQGAEIAAAEALSTLQAANNNVEQTRQLLEEIQTQMARLKQLQDEYNAAVDAQHREQIDAARQGVSTAKTNVKAGTLNATEEAAKTAGRAAQGAQNSAGYVQNIREANEAQEKAEAAAAKESEQFSANLKASIARWMSVQQIINIVKNGIRQAYQDIQGLDKAMTNIAVVTDMSVGDLWGKINDYMSIAQQYGVTTQGVYEVSQLYYQQGLSTSEVMAATTETLKMARIAGMDYAEAADAMTVAIRAFKMEMSDAQTVTDVYSKVAAVTASDSEELAVAMSKTASSAESVGSSFENTTAMLAVMIETTRESAQNLGSALKSIISRYGEMKTGLTVDSEGEAIDYNKVDTALKSVGISIKDAQGQFRNFDDVIFELSEKWDTLDKNTQRYIATIMAGNRQQSRFIALVDNWERLDEVATAAQDSEDAGLLQYAKTLDSLETKINNIKTSFQEFYMSILNGPVFGAALEFINDLIKGLNKLSKFTTILNITSIISGFKVLGSILVNTFSTAFSQVSSGWKSMLENMTLSARTAGTKAGKQYQMGWSTGKTLSSKATLGISALSLVGTGLTMAGTAVANKNQEAGTVLSSLGTGLQIGTMVGMINPVAGAITGALAAIVSGIASWPSELEKAQQDLDKAQEKAEEANIERAQSKERYTNLRDTLKELERLKEIRFDSDANFDEWVKANEQALESYPELISTFDEANNAIVDLEAAEANLMQARMQAASAAREAADAQIAQALAQRATEQIEYTNTSEELNKLTGAIEYDDKYGIYAQYFTAAQIPAETAKELVNILHMTGEVPASLDQTIWAQQGRTAYGVLDPTSKDAWSLRTTNKQWAEAAKFLDMDTVAVSQWWALMAQITNGTEFAQMLSKTFSSDYLKEEYSEKDLLALLTNNKYTSARELAAASPEAHRELKQSDLAVDASLRSGINAYLDSYLLGLDSENTFLELGNAKQTMSLALIDSFNEDFQTALADNQNLDVKEYWKNWTETKFITLSTELEAALDELYKNLSIAGDIDEYNDLIKNASSYNKDEYTTALGDLGLEVSAGIGKILVDQFTEKATKASEDFKAALENIDADTNTDLNFEAALAGSGVSIPQAYTDEVAEYARRLQKQVSSGLMGDDDANTYFEEYLQAWEEVLATNDIALRELFAETDFQSLESVATLLTSLSEKGLLGEGDGQVSQQTLESLIPHALINLNTSYSSLISNLAKDIDAKAAQINKAQSGFDTLADTQQFAEDMGLTLDDFTFDNGKWYVQATKESFAKIQNKTGEILEKQRDLVEKSFTEQLNLIEGNNQLKDLTTKEAPEDVDQLLTVLTQDSGETLSEETQAVLKANWSNYVDWIAANTDKADTTFAQYLRNTYEATLSALDQEQADYFDWLEKEWAYSESIRNRVSELSGDETAQRKQKAWDTIASKGTEGYSAQDIAEIEAALGIKDLGIKQADGSFNIVLDKLVDIPPFVQNALLSIFNTESRAALAAIDSLTQKILTGEATDSDYREAFDEQGELSIETLRTDYSVILSQALAGNLTGLTNLLLSDVMKDATPEEAEQEAKKIAANAKDTIAKNNLRLIELAQKQLEGTITETEKLEISQLQVGNTFSDLQNKLTQAGETVIVTWADIVGAVIDGSIEWGEIEGGLSKHFKTQLESVIEQQSGQKINLVESINEINDAAGKYSASTLESFAVAFAEQTGQTIDFESQNFIDAFKWDPDTETFEIISKEAYENWVNSFSKGAEFIAKAFVPSENKKIFTKINLSKTLAESFANLYADLEKATLEDFSSLYDSIHGEDQFVESGVFQIYQKAIESGNEQILNTLLNSLWLDAEAKGIEIDKAEYEALLADLQQNIISTLLSNIESAINGSLTATDLVNLEKKLNLDLSAYTTQTASGIQLSQQGALTAATQAAKLYGSVNELAQQLVDAYSGTEDILGSWSSIQKVMDSSTDELKDQEAILKQMQYIYATMADNADFNFLESSPLEAYTEGLDSFISNAGTAIDTLKEISSTGKASYTSFRQLFEYLRSSDGSIKLEGLEGGAKSLDTFYEAMMRTLDFSTGKVNFEAFAAEFGMTAESMSDSLSESLRKTAEEQAAYWDSIAETLKGYEKIAAAMEGSSIDFSLTFNRDTDIMDGIDDPDELITYLNGIEQQIEQLSGVEGFEIELDSAYTNWVKQSGLSMEDYFKLDPSDQEAISANFFQAYQTAMSWAQEEFSMEDWIAFGEMGAAYPKFWSRLFGGAEESAEDYKSEAEKVKEILFTSLGVGLDGVGEITYQIKIDSKQAEEQFVKFLNDNGFQITTQKDGSSSQTSSKSTATEETAPYTEKPPILDKNKNPAFAKYKPINMAEIELRNTTPSDTQLQETITTLREANNTLTEQNAELQEQYQSISQTKAESEKQAALKISSLETINTDLQTRLTILQSEITSMEGNEAELLLEVQNLSNMAAGLLQEKVALENQNAEINEQLAETLSEKNVLETTVSELNAQIAANEEQISGLKEELAQATLEAEQIGRDAQGDIVSLQSQIDILTAENQEYAVQVDSLITQLETANNTLQQVTSDLAFYKENASEWEQDYHKLQAEYNAYKTEVEKEPSVQQEEDKINVAEEVADAVSETNQESTEQEQVILTDIAQAGIDGMQQAVKEIEAQKAAEVATIPAESQEVTTSGTIELEPVIDMSQYIDSAIEATSIVESQEAVMPINGNISALIAAAQQGKKRISNLVGYMRIYGIYSGIKQDDTEEPITIEGDGVYTGNVSGLAFAEGNSFEKLNAGARLANKTLIGELGPELAVYNGMYHLLGQHGAEFVDLPKDAIVFNHRQTEGIIKGQAGIRGHALADGNVTGPAYASGGLSAAIAAAEALANMWNGIASNTSLLDLLAGSTGGGGGSGNTIQAVTEELEEWYNLTRQIADLEQKINNITAQRANILEKDGAAYLRSLREEQALLDQQIMAQEALLTYQEIQLKRQEDQITNNPIWSQFLEFKDGVLQYKDGNETEDGKGALSILQQLNEMSGAEQIKYLESIGYSYTTADGKKLEGSELVEKFFEELQAQIDNYDALYDTVNETESVIEGLKTAIEDINREILENQMELEQAIYDIIVSAWEAEIEAMEEHTELVKEANEAYIDGLNNALSEERELYSRNQSIEDREAIQRQLALLRRSGGSASEIADLERQLDDMLKDEYFNNQSDMIEDIQEANEKQVKQLEEQIQLEKDALEYQKENGVIWSKVYEVMSGSTESILAFMQGNSTDFFNQSTLKQEEMLTRWAKMIGIYDENKVYENFRKEALDKIWNTGDVWSLEGMSEYQDFFKGLTAEQQQVLADTFAKEYANARLAEDDEETAKEKARKKTLAAAKKLKEAKQAEEEAGGKKPATPGDTTTPNTGKRYRSEYTVQYKNKTNGEIKTYTGYGTGTTAEEAEANAAIWLEKRKSGEYPSTYPASEWSFVSASSKPQKAYEYMQGGLVDYTGVALVHGSKRKPEAFLNAEQTAIISEALTAVGDSGALDGIKRTLAALNANVQSIVNHISNEVSSFTVAPGAVTIQVEELKDSYDIEKLSNDIMNRMVTIASKSTNRGINRR